MMIPMIFPSCKYKEEYKDLAEQRKKLKEKPKARKDAEDFSLIFDSACKAVSGFAESEEACENERRKNN